MECRQASRRLCAGAVVCFGVLASAPANAQAPDAAAQPPSDSAQPPAGAPRDLGWPRTFEKGDVRVVVHQPQVDQWKDYSRITFRSAVQVAPGKGEEERWGVIEVSADTKVDKEE